MLWSTSKVTTLGNWYLQRLHCGCIASSSLLELLDCGGVTCINCTKNSGIAPVRLTYIRVDLSVLLETIDTCTFGIALFDIVIGSLLLYLLDLA
jgi:hypothetical protein